jgi:hypothetical protein
VTTYSVEYTSPAIGDAVFSVGVKAKLFLIDTLTKIINNASQSTM